MAANIGIFYHTDPIGNVPSGIDSFIRGILQWAPDDLRYCLFGATSDPTQRPVGREATVLIQSREVRYLPVMALSAALDTRGMIPETVRYMQSLRRLVRSGKTRHLDILDFHRIEPLLLFWNDPRRKNLVLHQDMSILRHGSSDIMWRHAPWMYEAVERRAFRQASRIFCVRQNAVDRYRGLYPSMSDRFCFIPTWVDAETFRPPHGEQERIHLRSRIRQELGLPVDSRLLVFVGRLDRQKDPALLLSACARVLRTTPDLFLLVIGDGVLRAKIEVQIESEGLRGRVLLTGARSRNDIASFLRSSDLFVLSSAYEGMPIAVLESLATGTPVVSTDVGEVRLVLRNGVNGRISETRTPDALAATITEALASLEHLRGQSCVLSVAPFKAEIVLKAIYENHRRQFYHRQS